MSVEGRVLVVDDDMTMTDLLEVRLAQRGFEAVVFRRAEDALESIERVDPHVVLTDIRMDGMDGLAFCERVALCSPEIPVIVMTGHSNIDTAVGALRARAFDFLVKPLDFDALFSALVAALRYRAARRTNPRLPAEPSPSASEEVIGESPVMKHLFDLIGRVTMADTTVLITGESGTGKELVARALHQGSRRSKGPFVTVNCSALPESLLEAELFGHVKGAFTGAQGDRRGLFEQAHGGTLALDEIGEMPLHLQPKLLRAIQERVVRPIGGPREVPTDVRLIASTHQDLRELVQASRFRGDLFFRLNVVEIRVPPLRERGEDVLLCGLHFIERYARATRRAVRGMTPEASERLLAYSWPGNVRELQNVIERAVLLTRHEEITVADLPEAIRRYRPPIKAEGNDADPVSLEDMKRKHIARVLEMTGGNKTLAAQLLGIDRRTLYRQGYHTPSDD